MSTSSTFSASRSEAGIEVNPNNSGVPVPSKSFIVGKYDDYGMRKQPGQPAGGTGEADKLVKQLIKSMTSRGELMPGFVMTPNGPVRAELAHRLSKEATKQTVPEKAKRGRKPKQNKDIEYVQPQVIISNEAEDQDTIAAETFSVVFSVESGTIRSTADAVLENDQFVLLVYRDVESISYLPQHASKLTLVLPGNRNTNVMYLGAQFTWYNSSQQLLMFIKTDIED